MIHRILRGRNISIELRDYSCKGMPCPMQMEIVHARLVRVPFQILYEAVRGKSKESSYIATLYQSLITI
jgi:hypothetical protein